MAGEGEDVERLLVVSLGADAAVEARHGFHVVIVDVGARIEHAGDGVLVATEVRSEDFDFRERERFADFADGFGPVVRAAIGEFVAIDAGDDNVLQIHLASHVGNMGGFSGVEGEFLFRRISFGHRTEAATARAEVPEDHERSRAAVEALVNIRTPG